MAPASVGLELRRPKPYGSRLTSTCGHGGRLGAIADVNVVCGWRTNGMAART
jgi:hypothetical protein